MANLIMLCLLWAFSVSVQAGVLPPNATQSSWDPTTGIFSEHHNSETGETFKLWVKDYTGPPARMEMNSYFTPTTHFQLAGNSSVLEKRDICQSIADCIGRSTDSGRAYRDAAMYFSQPMCASIANSVGDFLRDKAFAQTKKILKGYVAEVAIVIATSPFTYYMNAAFSKGSGGSKSDACSQTLPSVYAGDAETAVYDFCMAIRHTVQEKVPTRYIMADSQSEKARKGTGVEGFAKAFISEQRGRFADVCHDFGIDFKRLLRG